MSAEESIFLRTNRKYYDLMWRVNIMCSYTFRNFYASWVGTSHVGTSQSRIKWVQITLLSSVQTQISGSYLRVMMTRQYWQIHARIYIKICWAQHLKNNQPLHPPPPPGNVETSSSRLDCDNPKVDLGTGGKLAEKSTLPATSGIMESSTVPPRHYNSWALFCVVLRPAVRCGQPIYKNNTRLCSIQTLSVAEGKQR